MEENSERNEFSYNQSGNLCLKNIDLVELADKYPTPFFLYNEEILTDNFNQYYSALKENKVENFLLAYALKANNNPKLVNILAKLGSGADIVSQGELICALENGVPANSIIFSGVGKTREEIEAGIKNQILSFNVESVSELRLINEMAKNLNLIANISFRLNPEVLTQTHQYISTGSYTHKFGLIDEEIITAIKDQSLFTNTKLKGISIHIGSQLTNLDATKEAIVKLCNFTINHNLTLEFLDIGGGLGINYAKDTNAPTINQYISLVVNTIRPFFKVLPKLIFEPGRSMIGNTGYFVTKVIRTKYSRGIPFIIVDGGMNDFVRPALYGAYHEILPGTNQYKDKTKANLVGPICESSDFFANDRLLPILKDDSIYVMLDAGAYGYSMGSTYNMRKRPIELLLDNSGKIQEIR